MASYESLRNLYQKAGQDHVFTFYDTLSPSDQTALLAQLEELDVERVNRIHAQALQAESKATIDPVSLTGSASDSTSDDFEPLPEANVASVLASPARTAGWRERGLKAIERSEVAVLLMAGGQGTRLGSTAPKGCFDIGLPAGKSLFQLQAERIRRLESLAGGQAVITWFVMTSAATRPDTEAYFKKNAFFGLKEKNVIFFQQGYLPCLTEDGKILLSSPSQVALAPDGNGGLYSALLRPVSPTDDRTVMSIIKDRKIKYIHGYGVDNCLVRVADPTFIGFGIDQQVECGAKVVPKTEPTESVGVVARKGGRFGVVEYTELPQAKSEQRDPDGKLSYRAANIVNHFYTTEFLDRIHSIEHLMAFHIARKKIPTVDLQSGKQIAPSSPNGMKLELFVFDVFPFTKELAVLEVERTEEFSPLKNGPGTSSDNAVTSRRDLLAQQKRWVEAVGGVVNAEVEISPLISYAVKDYLKLRQ
ncbi:UDP-N-acetylglucosamine pyrophosphorylase [Phaffia rhodozyma]|uniref:UDP-N-acetylglucosamine diphosphorylase n=1 Tax=Phaffia rhodozyma TaxID=264483 RepID=A0A0F7SUD9_PHARH|nr:UDP-N-acetylglucosamine pyrophosphorylase [Phaffia rhodozyma]